MNVITGYCFGLAFIGICLIYYNLFRKLPIATEDGGTSLVHIVSKSYVRITMNEAEIDAGWNFFEDSVSAIKYFEEHKWRSDAKYGIMTVYKELWEITKNNDSNKDSERIFFEDSVEAIDYEVSSRIARHELS